MVKSNYHYQLKSVVLNGNILNSNTMATAREAVSLLEDLIKRHNLKYTSVFRKKQRDEYWTGISYSDLRGDAEKEKSGKSL